MSQRAAIFDAVVARMESLSYTVERWRTSPVGEDELSKILVSDPTEKAVIEDKNSRRHIRRLKIVISIVSAAEDATETGARVGLADVITAIGEDPTWGGLAMRSLPDEESIIANVEDASVEGAHLEFWIEYSRPAWAVE